MIHTVKIDDSTINGKRLLNELKRYKKEVEFEDPTFVAEAPEGYMTAEKFRKESRKDIDNLCKKHGLL